jgi:hypothetical protein
LDTLTTSHWIAVVAVAIAVISLYFNAANYLADRRERRSKSADTTPEVKATINSKRYDGRWRSVQLHVIGPAGQQQNFEYGNWVIERASLLRPWNAVLARAENDDYATGVFYPENPVRGLVGKAEGRLQRFALEFFVKYKSEDKGQKSQVPSDIFARERATAAPTRHKDLGRRPFERGIAKVFGQPSIFTAGLSPSRQSQASANHRYRSGHAVSWPSKARPWRPSMKAARSLTRTTMWAPKSRWMRSGSGMPAIDAAEKMALIQLPRPTGNLTV